LRVDTEMMLELISEIFEITAFSVPTVMVELFNVLILAFGETLRVEKLPVLQSIVATAITDTLKILEFKFGALTVLMVAVVPIIVVAVKPLAFIVLPFIVPADAVEV